MFKSPNGGRLCSTPYFFSVPGLSPTRIRLVRLQPQRMCAAIWIAQHHALDFHALDPDSFAQTSALRDLKVLVRLAQKGINTPRLHQGSFQSVRSKMAA